LVSYHADLAIMATGFKRKVFLTTGKLDHNQGNKAKLFGLPPGIY